MKNAQKFLLLKNCEELKGRLVTLEEVYKIIVNPGSCAWFARTRELYNQYIFFLDKDDKAKAKQYRDLYSAEKNKLYMAQYGTAPPDGKRDGKHLSGFFYMDFDGKENNLSAEEIKETLIDNYSNLALCYKSVSGAGVSAIFWFGSQLTTENYSTLYYYLSFEIEQKFNLKADEQCSNYNRGSFISNDLEAYYDPNFKQPDTDSILTQAFILTQGKEMQSQEFYVDSVNTFEKDIYDTIEYCKKNNKLLVTDYDQWYKLLSVIVKNFSHNLDKCYKIANDVSEIYAEKYSKEDTDKKVKQLLGNNLKRISEKTFYYYAKQAGYRIYKEKKGEITYAEFRNLLFKTDTELVLYIIETEFKNNIIFNVTTKEYMFYAEGVWKTNPAFRMNQKFDEWLNRTKNIVLNEINYEYNQLTEAEKIDQEADFKQKRANINTFWERFKSARNNKSISSHFEFVNTILKAQPDFDKHNTLICLKNGVYDFNEMKLRQHDKKFDLTKTLQFNYDAYAKCPNFLKFMGQIFENNKEYIDFFQKFIGISLTGRIDLFQGVVFMYGSGGNGKSLFMNMIKEFLSEFSCHISSDLIIERKGFGINEDYEKASLFGKRLVTISEIPTHGKMKENILKDLTGGDEIKSRQIREKVFNFKPTFKILMAGNHKPYIQGGDEGIWRRLFLVNFNKRFTEAESRPEQEIMREIRKEFCGIFNWAVQGYKDVIKEGMLKMTNQMKADVAEYRSTQSPIGDFLSAYYKPCEGASELRDDVYQTYTEYARDNLSLRETLSLMKFSKAINNSFFGSLKLSTKRFGKNQTKYIYNIKKLTPEERDAQDTETVQDDIEILKDKELTNFDLPF